MITLIIFVGAAFLILFAIRLCFKNQVNGDNTNSAHRKKKNTFSHTITKLPPNVKGVKDKFGLGGSGTSVITISLSKEALESKSYQGFATVFETLAMICPVILIQPTTESMSEAESTREMMNRFPNVIPTLVPEHRLLYYKTTVGKVAILRQLRPSMHIEFDPAVCAQVAPFMRVITVSLDSSTSSYQPASDKDDSIKNAAVATYSSISSILDLLRVP